MEASFAAPNYTGTHETHDVAYRIMAENILREYLKVHPGAFGAAVEEKYGSIAK